MCSLDKLNKNSGEREMNREVPFVNLSLHFISCTNIKKNSNVLAQPTQPTSWVSPTPGRQISPTQPTGECTINCSDLARILWRC